jgi:hypothetical protein
LLEFREYGWPIHTSEFTKDLSIECTLEFMKMKHINRFVEVNPNSEAGSEGWRSDKITKD